MKTNSIQIANLQKQRTLDHSELEMIQGGRIKLDPNWMDKRGSSFNLSQPEPYMPETNSVWVREIVEDVEAY